MTVATYVLIVAGSLAAIYGIFRLARAVRVYLTFRGKRLVSCPENHRPAAVRVATGKTALEAMVGDQQLTLSACSRWPERQACGQECLAQIEEAPKACMVSTIINRWYQGQECVYCHTPFGEIHWHDHAPALLNRELRRSNGMRFLPKTCRTRWGHTGLSAGVAIWPRPFDGSIQSWLWTGHRVRYA
jgi:hypothetical protein